MQLVAAHEAVAVDRGRPVKQSPEWATKSGNVEWKDRDYDRSRNALVTEVYDYAETGSTD